MRVGLNHLTIIYNILAIRYNQPYLPLINYTLIVMVYVFYGILNSYDMTMPGSVYLPEY